MGTEPVQRALDLYDLIYPNGRLESVEYARAGLDRVCEELPVPADVHAESVDAGGVPAEWVTVPESLKERTILYAHGGGFAVGSPRTTREMVAAFARAARARALVIDYRLAPEHVYPAAHDDALAAYRWLLDSGCPLEQLVVAGDSAGAGLVLSTLVSTRDAGLGLPRGAVLVSPWVDLEVAPPPPEFGIDAHEAETTVDGLRQLAGLYLAGADPRDPRVSPVRAVLTGLPPLLVLVAAAEGMVNDALRLVERARQHGVDVTLEYGPGMVHVWTYFSSFLPEARIAVEQVGRFVRQRLGQRRVQQGGRPLR